VVVSASKAKRFPSPFKISSFQDAESSDEDCNVLSAEEDEIAFKKQKALPQWTQLLPEIDKWELRKQQIVREAE